MQTADALAALFFLAAIVIWATSPARWQTFKKMAVAFIATVTVVVAVGFAVGYLYSSPAITGSMAQESVGIGLVVALIMGRQHVRSLKSKAAS
jgi:hypothetical protein